MIQFRYIFIFIVIVSRILFSANISAQENEISFRDFNYLKNSDSWFTSHNAAGLNRLSGLHISKAEVTFLKEQGDFINYYKPDNSYQIGADAESFYRLNSMIVFYGKISYHNFKGKNMGGSIFINPYYNPFDIVERADSNRGTKQMETYQLTGAISADIYKGILLGLKMNYEATNYAKFKDLRHTNKWLDFSFSTGISYHFNNWLEIGGNYSFRRTVEDINLKTFGNTERNYYSLISYGAFFGQNELYTSSGTGYTNTADRKSNPLLNKFNGGSVQLNINLTSSLVFFNEFTFAKRRGHYGEKSANTLYFTTHNGDEKQYTGILSYKTIQNHYNFKINAGTSNLENYEMIFQHETDPEGRGSTVIYYGNSQKLDKQVTNIETEFTVYLGVKEFNPIWKIKAGFRTYKHDLTASFYPYYRMQKLTNYQINLQASRNLVKGANMYTFSLGGLYGCGSGTPLYDNTYAGASDSKNTPATLDNMLYKEYEYLTASHIKVNVSIGYSHLFKNNIQGFVHLQYEHTQAFDITYLNGKSFEQIMFKVGCLF